MLHGEEQQPATALAYQNSIHLSVYTNTHEHSPKRCVFSQLLEASLSQFWWDHAEELRKSVVCMYVAVNGCTLYIYCLLARLYWTGIIIIIIFLVALACFVYVRRYAYNKYIHLNNNDNTCCGICQEYNVTHRLNHIHTSTHTCITYCILLVHKNTFQYYTV